MSLAVAPAPAAAVDECQASLSALRQDTLASSGAFTNIKDVDGLVAKLDNGATKLAEGKNADAIDKLVGYQTTLSALASAPKPKVDPSTASSLSAGAQGVIDCINSLN